MYLGCAALAQRKSNARKKPDSVTDATKNLGKAVVGSAEKHVSNAAQGVADEVSGAANKVSRGAQKAAGAVDRTTKSAVNKTRKAYRAVKNAPWYLRKKTANKLNRAAKRLNNN